VLHLRSKGEFDSDVLTEVMDALDVEESMIDRRAGRAESAEGETLTTPEQTAGACVDLARAPEDRSANTPDGCEECLRDGTRWVHLRLCLACGHVGCCDSSVHKHATAHFHESLHPVMRSFEPGEAWRWCFVHEVLG
jgi:CPA1 family monovalent cation:H+ antiporter